MPWYILYRSCSWCESLAGDPFSAASPTHVFNYVDRYEIDVVLARDVVLLTTLASLPVLLVLSVVLG